MSRQSRIQVLKEISINEDSKVLAYVTGDRPGLHIPISSEHLPLFPKHINALNSPRKITLLLYTRGGDTNAPWPLISFLRENCDFLQVMFPLHNHSSGTLLALGADEIVMGPYSSLSPIDPTVYNQFNPSANDGTQNKVPIAVEDMLAYFELVKDEVQDKKGRARAFDQLISNLHPLALGNVRRNINLIRTLARKLIRTHSKDISEKEISQLVTALTTEFYTHNHLIGRVEARELGLKIKDATKEQNSLMDRYLDELNKDLKLLENWNVINELNSGNNQSPVLINCLRAIIETEETCDEFITKFKLESTQLQTPTGMQNAVNTNLISEGWESK